ncbi:MAG: ATP-binding protein, partial [Pseudomonadota bacterium]|nr:ATP-binding protein [Pseudomonadota bacterium]
MYAPINHEQLQKKWAPILDHEGTEPIKDQHKRMVTAQLLENQEQAIREEREFLSEAVPTNSTGSSGATAGFSAGADAPVAGF